MFENPYLLLISSFALLALTGTVLLAMPFSSASGQGLSLFDCLFTATSAVCVTGLVVLDTFRDFSFIGQLIILLLIQTGGLGIVTIMTFVSLLLGQTIGIGREYVVGEIIGSRRPKMVYDLIRLIVFSTILVESLGAVILTLAFQAREGNWFLALWKGIFHAISAFCNAGFALQNTSLVEYNRTWVIPLTVCLLIVIGGLGFPVISHLIDILLRKNESKTTPVLVRVSIRITVLLVLMGYLLFFFTEYNHGLAGLSWSEKHLNALFLSITARTAGFNSVDMNLLSGGSIMLLLFLMFIGAGSCSTAGGIKITTFGVLMSTVASFVKGQMRTILFEKRVPVTLVMKATVLLIVSIALIITGTIVLQISQDLSLSETLFEVISAFGTVGLSLGATLKLDDFGKFVIVIIMFIGRVNILTFISLFIPASLPRVQYPEESIMIG